MYTLDIQINRILNKFDNVLSLFSVPIYEDMLQSYIYHNHRRKLPFSHHELKKTEIQ